MPAVVKKCGSKWCVYDHEGGDLAGKHDTKEEAEAQRRAIMASLAGYGNKREHK